MNAQFDYAYFGASAVDILKESYSDMPVTIIGGRS